MPSIATFVFVRKNKIKLTIEIFTSRVSNDGNDCVTETNLDKNIKQSTNTLQLF
jgi:hypothetical protein